MVLPGSSIGRYQVKRKLAEGGMAELYLCTAMGPEGFEKEVVIKRIKAFLSGDPSFIEMFKAEARLASRLNHANVVQIFDFDKHDDAWFIAMEYVYGASLWELRRRCRELAMPFPPVLVAEIGAQVARGLHYAHTLSDKGKPLALVHRDVTPHNVLMSFDGGVKLTDFGIAKAGTSFTAPGMLKGKFAYMSPEQARGEKVDLRTDVFALGITLWEMLTGGRLFEGDSEMAVLRAVQESLIAPPSRLNPDVPAELSDIVMKALSRPLEQRYQTAHELDRALAGFVLKNSSSPEDSNVGLFLRQMFRDELEAVERELANPSAPSQPGQEPSSQTPVVDAYALGNTKQVNRQHDPPTQQTATPLPSAPPPVGPAPQKTAEMPGQRRSRPLPPLAAEGGAPVQRTEQMNEVGRESTAAQPGVRPSRKMVPLPELAPALNVPETAKTEPRGMDATVPGRAPVLQQAPSNEVTTPVADDGRRSALPWILGAAVVAGLIAGLAYTRVGQTAPQPPPTPAVVEIPIPIAEAPPPAPAPPPLAVPVVAAVEPTPEPAPAPKEDVAPAVKPVVAAAKGTLTIDAVPYGLVFINNAKAGEVSGKRSFPLAPGTYAIRISHTRLEMNESVVIKSGKNVTLTFRPQVAPAQ